MGGLRALLFCACGSLAGGIAFDSAALAAAPEAIAPAPSPAPSPASAPAAANVERAPEAFTIEAFDISGVTALSAEEVERLVYPHAGPGRGNADVEAARKALQDAYAAKGYGAALVDVPVQQRELFSQGIVQIAVSESPIGEVRVTDSRFHSLWVARGQVPSLVEGKPVDFKALQAEVAAANRFPDRSVNPVFKPGQVPGTLDVDLKVSDQRPLHASVQLDNDASPNTSRLRLTATARYTNLFQTGQSATLTYIVAPQNRDDTEVFAGSYSIPLLHSPWAFSVSGYASNSNVASLGGSSVLGNGFQVGLRAIRFLASSKYSQSISFGFDYKDFKQKILVASATASSAPIRYIPFEATYSLSGATEHSTFSASLGGTFGLRTIKGVVCIPVGTTCIDGDAFRNREQFSNENFVHANLSFDYAYGFDNDLVAAFRLTGQFADSHLITNEQFSAGGRQSVRGYYSAEAVGDDGIAPSLELRSPSIASRFGTWLNEARIFAFVDSAFLSVRDPLPGQTSSFRLVGVGGGLRLRVLKRFSGELLGAVPLTGGTATSAGDPQLSFQVKGEF